MSNDAGRLTLKLPLCCMLVAGLAAPAGAQIVKLQQAFEDAMAPGWTLSGSAVLTAAGTTPLDPPGSGWLRLTPAINDELGLALDTALTFGGGQAVVVEFNYVAWGGTGGVGADGMTVFLYDSSQANPMSGAVYGGGLGYCGGAGGYLAIGLDEYGNFSNPGDRCGASSGGPGRQAEKLVIRGPLSANNQFVTNIAVPGGIDDLAASSRPSARTVLLSLTPAVAGGYTITAQFRSAAGQPFATLFSNQPFPYVAPASLSIGLSGGTGGKNNNHELQGLAAASPDDLQVTLAGPASVLQGAPVSYTVTVTNNGIYPISGTDAPAVLDTLPAAISAATWTCTGTGGATCAASGSGNLSSSDLALPVNASVTYTITGTLAPGATCGSTLTDTASAEFGSASNFLDPDETNNVATVNSQVTCDTTLVSNPTALAYPPQQENTASTSQSVTLTGVNTATVNSIAVSGDYSQTNDCPASLPATQTCTVTVVFTPTALGSRNGTLTIISTAAASPVITTVIPLSGTGINAAPDAFTFTPLTAVDPSSLQISNPITVNGTDVPTPISVSAGGQYSINGGAFTAAPGIVSPGAQVQVQLTAASGYSSTDAATLTIGGVSSAFTVTTGTQPAFQGSFAPVTGAVPASVQVSNAITVTGTIAALPISVSNGSLYSINGGPFTAANGTVQPGDQVTIETTASPGYSTTTSAILNVGGTTSTFTVTTAAQPTVQGGFTPVTGAGVASPQVSNPITIMGTVPAPISISGGGEYSINGGPFTSAAGTVQPGDQVRVQLAAATSYDTTVTTVLTINGVHAQFAVTTGPAPLPGVVVTTGGGGALGVPMLLMLALLAAVRLAGLRRAALLVPVAVSILAAFAGAPARADEGVAPGPQDATWVSHLYGGVRIGDASSSLTAAKLTRGLQADGYQVTASGANWGGASGTLYIGYELRNGFAVELAQTYLGHADASLSNVAPGTLTPVLADAARIGRGDGDFTSLEGRYRWNANPRIDVDLRAGPYLWITRSKVAVAGVTELTRTDTGPGFTLGVNPRYDLGHHVGLGLAADYFESTSSSHFLRFALTLEYHVR